MKTATPSMTTWKQPPRIKVYEALGALADGRIKRVIHDDDSDTVIHAQVTSSKGDKTYTVWFDPSTNIISSNDNGSYWQGYVGYPAIALLCLADAIVFSESVAQALANIPWKELNTQTKNDFAKTEKIVLREYVHTRQGVQSEQILEEIDSVMEQLAGLKLFRPAKREIPRK
jgi:hypothetical protein